MKLVTCLMFDIRTPVSYLDSKVAVVFYILSDFTCRTLPAIVDLWSTDCIVDRNRNVSWD